LVTGEHAAVLDSSPANALAEDDVGDEIPRAESGDAARLPDADAPARPANAARSLFHVSAALVSLLFTLVLFTPTELPWVAASIAGSFWTLEGLRRPFPRFNAMLMRFFRPIAHPLEAHRVNSATWLMTALTVVAASGDPVVCVVAVCVVGFGDPAASWAGRRWGRIRVRSGRTLEGAIAFVATGTITTTGTLMLVDVPPSFRLASVLAVVASLAGAATELLSRRLDDNLTVPLVAATATMVVLTIA
jgi:dolichol kinase